MLKRIAYELSVRLARFAGHTGLQNLAKRKAEWKSLHQPFELDYHQHENIRWDDEQFMARWSEIFGSFCKLRRDQFGSDNVIIDIGCGSRPAFDWFDNRCVKYYLDPLLDQYREIPEVKQFWQDKPQTNLLARPAEEFVESLEATGDFINCWNVLDHTYDWRSILLNLWRYAKPGALLCIGVDLRSYGDGHPGIDDPGFLSEFVASHFHILEKREHAMERELALFLRQPTSMGFRRPGVPTRDPASGSGGADLA